MLRAIAARLKPAYVAVAAGTLGFAYENERARRYQQEAEYLFLSDEGNDGLSNPDTQATQREYIVNHIDPMEAHSRQHRFRIIPDYMVHGDFSHRGLIDLHFP